MRSHFTRFFPQEKLWSRDWSIWRDQCISAKLVNRSSARARGRKRKREKFSGPLDEKTSPSILQTPSRSPLICRGTNPHSYTCTLARNTHVNLQLEPVRTPEARQWGSYLLNIQTGDTPRSLFRISVASYFIGRKVWFLSRSQERTGGGHNKNTSLRLPRRSAVKKSETGLLS